MKSLSGPHREAARPLYEGYVGLHGAIDAILEDSTGRVWVDDAKLPTVARIVVGDFHIMAGDPERPEAIESLRKVPKTEFIAAPESWHPLVRRELPRAEPRDRFGFDAPEQWDRAHLAELRSSLPAGHELIRVDKSNAKAFRHLNETFVDNFKSLGDYLKRGVGFAVTNERGEMVAGCSTYTISSRRLEFEIETREDYRLRGLALVTGARMIEHCLEVGLEPCWDAAHEGSARLAERLGFVNSRKYTAYRLT